MHDLQGERSLELVFTFILVKFAHYFKLKLNLKNGAEPRAGKWLSQVLQRQIQNDIPDHFLFGLDRKIFVDASLAAEGDNLTVGRLLVAELAYYFEHEVLYLVGALCVVTLDGETNLFASEKLVLF